MNDFTEQTNLILSELTKVTEDYDPLNVSKQTLESVVTWLQLIALAKIERLRDVIDSTKEQ